MRCAWPYSVSTNGHVLGVRWQNHPRYGPYLASRWTLRGGNYVLPPVEDLLGRWAGGSLADHYLLRMDETGTSIAFAHSAYEIEDRSQVLLWSAAQGTRRLVMYPWGRRIEQILLSRDGATVVWASQAVGTNQSAMHRWRTTTGLETLLGLQNLLCLSGDGNRVFGIVAGNRESIGWIDRDGELHHLGPIQFEGNPTLHPYPVSLALDPAGTTLFATAGTSSGNVLMRYRFAGARWDLAGLSFPGTSLRLAGITDDARMVVGEDRWIWTEEHGIQTAEAFLTRRGVDLAGWELLTCLGVSGNGKTLIGSAYEPVGPWGLPSAHGWVAFLDPAPAGSPTVVDARRGPAVLLEVAASVGNQYRVQHSRDLQGWSEVGEAFIGEGTLKSFGFPADSSGSGFYRVLEEP
ncbi:MAG: hypothetical protein IT580_22830 [Verrucomicrobiales bacterium]|nr:hypothetical protein [Verrucomicrobiales bacterium]